MQHILYKKRVMTTLKGETLKRFLFFCQDESMGEAEALRYLVNKAMQNINEHKYNQYLTSKYKS
jgi:hypothetical protein